MSLQKGFTAIFNIAQLTGLFYRDLVFNISARNWARQDPFSTFCTASSCAECKDKEKSKVISMEVHLGYSRVINPFQGWNEKCKEKITWHVVLVRQDLPAQARPGEKLHRKQRFASFPSPAGMSLPNSPWAGITELFLPRESLASDIPAGDGKLVNLF